MNLMIHFYCIVVVVFLTYSSTTLAFPFNAVSIQKTSIIRLSDRYQNTGRLTLQLQVKLSDKRKKELGIADDEDEYDLEQALNVNTDPLITKLIAGPFILVVIGLLFVAVIIPLTSDVESGLCNPILNGGRC